MFSCFILSVLQNLYPDFDISTIILFESYNKLNGSLEPTWNPKPERPAPVGFDHKRKEGGGAYAISCEWESRDGKTLEGGPVIKFQSKLKEPRGCGIIESF
jgi:hypothetical protein